MAIYPKVQSCDLLWSSCHHNVGIQCNLVLLLIMSIHVVLQFTCYHFRGLIYWLIDCLIKWSLHLYIADWLIIIIKLLLTKWLITSRLIDWQTDWLTFWLTDSLTDKMADWLLNKWLINWLVFDWPTDLLADLLTEWLTILLPEWTTCWPAERLTYWWLMD